MINIVKEIKQLLNNDYFIYQFIPPFAISSYMEWLKRHAAIKKATIYKIKRLTLWKVCPDFYNLKVFCRHKDPAINEFYIEYRIIKKGGVYEPNRKN